MVRLVFRPYTQVYRSICTSEPIRTSIRVSSDFVLLRHSSPSFGSQPVPATLGNLVTRLRQLSPVPLQRFHVLLNSLFKAALSSNPTLRYNRTACSTVRTGLAPSQDCGPYSEGTLDM
ncbi:hypothetical protein OSTOST_01493 [Ostertagia ostertagi]